MDNLGFTPTDNLGFKADDGLGFKSQTDDDKLSDQLKNLAGKGEGALSTLSGMLLGGPAMGLRTLGELAGGSDLDTALDRAQSSHDAITYAPQTKTGQQTNKDIGGFFDRYTQDFGSMFSREEQELAKHNPTLDTLKAEATARSFGEALSSFMPLNGIRSGERGMRPKVDSPPKELNPDGVVQDVTSAPPTPVDIPTPDSNPTLYADQRGVVTPDLPDAGLQAAKARLQGQEEVSSGPGRDIIPPSSGENPIYVDPQGQAFRGNPAEDNARLGLENQTDAFDNAATHNQFGTPPDPLPQLQQDALKQSNEGPQARPQDILDTGIKQSQVDSAVDNHPLVQRMQDKIDAQEQLITKLQLMFENGKGSQTRLVREVNNLKGLEQAMEKTRQNVEAGVKTDTTPTPFNFKKQGGAVNPEVFKKGFWRMKMLPDGTKLSAQGLHGSELQITAERDGHVVSAVTFDPRNVPEQNTTNLEPFSVATHADERGKGYATEMYRFASELGNDIMPSFSQSIDGKKMWDSFQRKGMVNEDGIIPKQKTSDENLKDILKADAQTHVGRMAQRGALLIDPKDADKGKFLDEHPALKLPSIVPEQLTIDKAIELSNAVPDVQQNVLQRMTNALTKGGLYQALKTDHPVVKFTVEKTLQADRLARGEIQNWVHDKLATASRELSGKEAAQIWEAIDRADFHKAPLSEEILRKNGANDAQINYWKAHRDTMDRVFTGLNNVRKTLGMDPVDKRVAYAAMRATGDFRRLIYKVNEDGSKSVVGIVGSDYRNVLNKRMEALKQDHPEYIIGDEAYAGGVPRDKGNAAAAMMQTLEVLAKDDPRIGEFMKTYKDLTSNEVYNFLNMKRHTMDKKGITGMSGRKSWLTAEENARDGMQAQISYTEAGLKWEALANAMVDVNKLLGDKDIQATAPNAVKWSKNYSLSALGYNPTIGHHLEQYFAKAMEGTGIGYGVARRGIAVVRKTINATLLGLNPAFILTNFVQPFQAMPGMKAYLASKGLNLKMDLGSGLRYFSNASMLLWKHWAGEPLTAIEQGAFDYAKKYHVYGSDLIEHSNEASKFTSVRIPYTEKRVPLPGSYYLDKVSSFASGPTESATRQVVYFANVQMLHENGLSVKNGLYEAAHNITDMTMNNYSPIEKPQIYNMLGPIGQMAGNLSSYKHNEMSRLSLFARQLQENTGLVNKVRPLAAHLAATIFYAGVLGLPAYQEGEMLYDWITAHLLKNPRHLTSDIVSASEYVTKQLSSAAGNSKYMLSHGIFSLANIDMSKRLGIQNLVGESVADTGFPGVTSLVKSAQDTAHLATDPTMMNAKRALHTAPFVPQPAKTNMELQWFSQNGMSHNPDTLKAGVKRDDADVMAKRLGFTGIHESVEKDKLYGVKTVQQQYSALRQDVLSDARDEIYSGGLKPATTMKYLKYEGDPNTLVSDLKRFAQEQSQPAYERALLQSAMSRSITNLREAQRLVNIHQ